MLDKTSTWKKERFKSWMISEKEKIEPKKDEVIQKAFELIASFEGLHLKAYWDYKHCSIGYWSKAKNCNEKITEEEARKRAIERIKNLRKIYGLEKYNDNIEIALLSFSYNVWHLPSNYDWYIKNGYLQALKNRMKLYIYAGEKKLKWLERRRNAEVSLF